MKKALLSTLLLLVTLQIQAQNHPKDVDSILNTYHAQGKWNGTALVTQYGRLVLEKGYGYKNTAQKTTNDTNTIYQIGSVTKTFTSTIILMLQKQGKLNVKDKLNKYFPDYPSADRVTLENLLTHTSGIYDYTEDTAFANNRMFAHKSREEMLDLFKDRGLEQTPGSKFSYSNSNYLLLGYIIEDVTHKNYYTVLREMILQPLGMRHTGCNFAGLKSKDKAIGYFSVDGDKGLQAPMVDSSVSFAAGCIYTTVGDLYKWADAVLKNKLLSKEDMATATAINKDNYGYGWMIGDIYGHKSIGHNGGVHGFVANLFIAPDDASTIILLTNDMGNDVSAIRRTISAVINNREYDLPMTRYELKMTPKQLQDYAGVYEIAPNFSIKVYVEDGKLMGQATGQSPFQLYASRMDYFFTKVVDAQIYFYRNKDNGGKVEKMMLRQGGRMLPGNKK